LQISGIGTGTGKRRGTGGCSQTYLLKKGPSRLK
jgi:hypothetical protein